MPPSQRRLLVYATLVAAALAAGFAHRDPSLIDEDDNLHRLTQQSIRSITSDIVADARTRLAALTAVAAAVPTAGHSSNDVLRDIRQFLRAYPSHMFVQWIEPDFEVRWTLDGEPATPVPLIVRHPLVREAIHTASARGEAVLSAVLRTQDGRSTAAAIVPIVDDGAVKGFVMTAIDIHRLMAAMLADQQNLGYAIAVSDNSRELYRTHPAGDEAGYRWAAELPVSVAGATWRVRVWPEAETVRATRSARSEISWLIGGLLVFALVVTAHGAHAERSITAKVREVRNQLERRVQLRTAELERANASLRDLSGQLLQLQDEERRRIARELHDSTVQTLAVCAISIGAARRAMDAGQSLEAESAFDQATACIDAATKEVRTLSHLLHPPVLEELGLAFAIEWYVEGFSARSGIVVTADVPHPLDRLPSDVELTLFRILQEGLTNVHRHSGSRSARVALARAPDWVRLEIEDFGHGPPDDVLENADGAPSRLGVGIAGMRERVRQLGGVIEFTNTGRGLAIRTVLPIDSAVAQPFVAPTADLTRPSNRAEGQFGL